MHKQLTYVCKLHLFRLTWKVNNLHTRSTIHHYAHKYFSLHTYDHFIAYISLWFAHIRQTILNPVAFTLLDLYFDYISCTLCTQGYLCVHKIFSCAHKTPSLQILLPNQGAVHFYHNPFLACIKWFLRALVAYNHFPTSLLIRVPICIHKIVGYAYNAALLA